MECRFLDKSKLGIYFFALFYLFTIQTKAQRSDDIGVFLGGSFYMGDINPNRLFYDPSPAFGIRYRYNYNPLFSMSYGFTRGKLEANDLDFDSDLFQHYRGVKLSDNYINELSAQIEYNLYPVTADKRDNDKFSPYIKIGLAMVFGEVIKPNPQITIPFGIGLKYKISKKIELSTEWSFRRTFSDGFDEMTTYYSEGIFNKRQRSFSKTRDWYSFFGINLHYCLKRTKLQCPAY